jgi:hypothetical protein
MFKDKESTMIEPMTREEAEHELRKAVARSAHRPTSARLGRSTDRCGQVGSAFPRAAIRRVPRGREENAPWSGAAGAARMISVPLIADT